MRVALLKFEKGIKVMESVFIDGGDLFKQMMRENGNFLLISEDGERRMTKGNIPLKVKGSFSWIK